jgi:hypothetical protein
LHLSNMVTLNFSFWLCRARSAWTISLTNCANV